MFEKLSPRAPIDNGHRLRCKGLWQRVLSGALRLGGRVFFSEGDDVLTLRGSGSEHPVKAR